MEGNWKFVEGESKSGGLGLLNMMQDLGGFSGGVDNQYIVLDADEGLMAFYGDRGDGTVEALGIIDVGGGPYANAIATFGSYHYAGVGVLGLSHSYIAVWGDSDADGTGVYGQSVSGEGVYGGSTSGTGGYFISGSNTGVVGVSTSGYGVSGSSTSTYGGYFSSVYVIGEISAATVTDRP